MVDVAVVAFDVGGEVDGTGRVEDLDRESVGCSWHSRLRSGYKVSASVGMEGGGGSVS